MCKCQMPMIWFNREYAVGVSQVEALMNDAEIIAPEDIPATIYDRERGGMFKYTLDALNILVKGVGGEDFTPVKGHARNYLWATISGGFLVARGLGVVSLDEEEEFELYALTEEAVTEFVDRVEDGKCEAIDALADADPSGTYPSAYHLVALALLPELRAMNPAVVVPLMIHCIDSTRRSLMGITRASISMMY